MTGGTAQRFGTVARLRPDKREVTHDVWHLP